MLRKITAAAMSTILSVTAALPCTVNASDGKTQKLSPYIVMDNLKGDTDAANIATTTAAVTTTASATTTTTVATETTTTTATSSTTTTTAAVATTTTATAAATTTAETKTLPEPLLTGILSKDVAFVLRADGTLAISGSGAVDTYRTSPFGEYADKVLRVEFTDYTGDTGVTVLTNSLFSGCTNLKEITIPETVKVLGEYLFDGCTSLGKVVIKGCPDSIGGYIFNGCTALEEITLPYVGFSPESVNCDAPVSSLTNLFSTKEHENTYKVGNTYGNTRFIPESLKSITVTGGDNIPSHAFENLSKVSAIVVPDNVKFIGDSAFINCNALEGFKMPSAATYIGVSAFNGCGKIDVDIPAKATYIGANAFNDCAAIDEINVPETVETIGEYAFSGCSSIKKAVINSGPKSIDGYIFNGCTALEELTLPYAGFSLESVNAEKPVSSLTNLFSTKEYDKTYKVGNTYGNARYIPESLKSITVTGGDNVPAHAFENLSKVSAIVVPDSVKFIGDSAFISCNALEGFKMPSAVTYIGGNAFSGCGKIDVDIPVKTTYIGAHAFEGCAAVDEINVPETVEMIGEYAFSGCSSMKKAVIKGCEKGIGGFLLNGCTALEELTLPYAGFSPESVNGDNPVSSLTNLFPAKEYDMTYKVGNTYGNTRFIPESLKSITVTGGDNIPSHAFENLSFVRTINIPDDIVFIGNNSFVNCRYLKNFIMPQTVEYIGERAFSDCQFINVDIPPKTTFVGPYAFSGCLHFNEINVPGTVTTLGEYAFNECSAMRKAVINGCKNGIGGFIFNGCNSLEELTLPYAGYSLESVNGEKPIASLTNLFSTKEHENTYKVGNTYGNTRYIPEALRDITITGGNSIPANAFENLSGVQNFTLPKTVAGVGENAFINCTGIDNVFYPDTEAKWSEVTVGKNNESTDGKIRFLDAEGNYKDIAAKLGDVNLNNIIDAVDASLVLAEYARLSTGANGSFSPVKKFAADVNSDGIIDAVDASNVLKYYAYLSTVQGDPVTMEQFMAEKLKKA